MGQEKALLEIEGQTAVTRLVRRLEPLFSKIIVVTNSTQVANLCPVPSLPDIFPNCGPLGGLHAALTHFRAPVFLLACDMPYIQPEFVLYMIERWQKLMAEAETTVPQGPGPRCLAPVVDGRFEPLHAIYAPQLLGAIETELNSSRVPSLQTLLTAWGADVVPEQLLRQFSPDLGMLGNWNTPADIKDTRKAPEAHE